MSLRLLPGEKSALDVLGDVPLLLNPKERNVAKAKLTVTAENAFTEIFHRCVAPFLPPRIVYHSGS